MVQLRAKILENSSAKNLTFRYHMKVHLGYLVG